MKTSKQYGEKRIQSYGGREIFLNSKKQNQKIRDVQKSLDKYKAKLEIEKDAKKIEKILQKIKEKEAFLQEAKPATLDKRIGKERKNELFAYGIMALVASQEWLEIDQERTTGLHTRVKATSHKKVLSLLFRDIKLFDKENDEGRLDCRFYDFTRSRYGIGGDEDSYNGKNPCQLRLHKKHVEQLNEFLNQIKDKGEDYLAGFISSFLAGVKAATAKEKEYMARKMMKIIEKSNTGTMGILKFKEIIDRLLKDSKY